jgi:uncharacterized protein (TIRG00374 family)
VRKDWRVLLGFGITALLLWWVLKDVDLAEVWAEIEGANFWLLGLAVAIATTNYLFRSMRWEPLLHPIHPNTSLRSRFAAMNIGFMANNLLPVRAGEFLRPYALSKMEPVSVSGAFGSLVVERFLDSLTIVALLFVAIAAPGFPDHPTVLDVSLEVWIRGILVLLGGLLVFMVLLLVFPTPLVRAAERLARFLPGRLSRLAVDVLEAFLDGLRVFQSPGLLLKATLGGVVVWLWQSLGFWVAFMAFGIHVSYDVALFVNAMVALAVAAPAAPGFIGTFHAGVTAGLGVYGVGPAPAAAVAIGFHLGGFIPVTLIGLYYAWRLGFSLVEVRESEKRVEEAVEQAHPVLSEDQVPSQASD